MMEENTDLEVDELQQSTDPEGLNSEPDSARQSGYFNLHVIIHNNRKTTDDSNETKDLEAYARSLLEPHFRVTDSSVQEGKWLPRTLSVDLILHVEQKRGFEEAIAELESEWFDSITAEEINRHLWLETDIGRPTDDSLSSSKHGVAVCHMSLGTFISADIYRHHWQSDQYTPDEDDTSPSYSPFKSDSDPEVAETIENQRLRRANIRVEFEHDTQTILIKHTDSKSETWKMEIAYDKLEKFLLVNVEESVHHLYFFINSQPKVFKQIPRRSRMSSELEGLDDMMENEERDVKFGTCGRKVIGSSNVLHLAISKRERNLKFLKSRFAKLGFSLILSNPKVQVANDSAMPRLPFKSFDVSFSWFCLLSRGFRVTDQMTEEFLSIVTCASDDPDLEEILNQVTAIYDRSCICNLKETFQEEMKTVKQRESSAEEKELQVPHVVKVRRILLTPLTIRGLGAEWTIENRVVLEFGADRFVRIVIRDEDFQLLSPSVKLNGPMMVVKDFLSKGLTIGDREYKFLGCSNSQLRQHGVWMYASDGVHTVATIREWMGDLADERCVATYVARLGQCFSSTRDSVELDNVGRIADIERGKYCFTDGIGKISKSLAKKVSDALRMSAVPSAFQIRYAGCKGVVSLAPDLGNEEKMEVRKSMEKFQSKHNKLEVMQTTKPGVLHLNKQVIMLMSGLKVPNESFFHLQEAMLKRLADMLIIEQEAVKVLCQSNLGLRVEVLKQSELAVTTEPFLRSVLLTVYQQQFKDLLRRTRIEIPLNKGRNMMGTVDETGSLEYGQVFVQYSTDMNKKQSKRQVLTGPLVIAKNPCFHPGDLRKFEGVDVPKLEHMVDCIVFPAKGSRPHPNEMSGSDLDGDIYFVCWDETLIPPEKNREPMDFTAQPKQCLDHQVSEADMIEFIANYIASDQVGVIANAHLVHADAKGISSDECLKLAQLHSDAVDFPKTGKCLRIPPELRPASYPHYMMKRDKPIYTSNHIIAKLFDQCQAIEQSNSHKERLPVQVDEDLLLPGYEKYLQSARLLSDFYERQMSDLMATYGIDSEAALLSVTVLKIQERRGYLKGDHFEIAEILRLKLQSIKQKLKVMFYEELQDNSDKSKTENDKSGNTLRESDETGTDCAEDDDSVKTSRKFEALLKASALYFITYGTSDPETIDSMRNIGLPWIFWDLLIAIKKLNAKACYKRDLGGIRVKWKSFLHKISADIIDTGNKLETESVEVRRKRIEVFTKILGKVNNSKLVLFGSTVSATDTPLSNLDVHVSSDCLSGDDTMDNAFQQIVIDVADAVGGEVSQRFLENPEKKVAAVTYFENQIKMQIVLYANKECLEKTAYIVAASVLNNWMIPALKVALAWARNNGLVGDARESSLRAEQFVIMFYYITIHKYQFGCAVSAEAKTIVTTFLKENHFLNCSVTKCDHIETHPDYIPLAESFAQLSLNGQSQSSTLTGAKASVDPLNVPVLNSADETRRGDVLLHFFRHFSTTRGRAEDSILNIPDPSSDCINAKLITNKKAPQCQQIVKKMMQAHHSLANSSSIQEFLNMGFNEDGPCTVVLPSQISSNIRYRKAYIAQKIKVQCGADMVTIREKKFRGDCTSLVLEAWGSASALLKVSEKVRDLVASSSMFGSDNFPMSRPIISDAHRIFFEHCEGPGASVVITPYLRGPCQPGHDTLEKQVARLWNPNSMDTYDMEHFISLFHKQRDFIVASYDKDFHGELRGVISYGTYYICNCKETGMTAKDFDTMVTERQDGCYSAHVNSARRPQRGRRGHRTSFTQSIPDKTKYIRATFIPTASANLKRLKELLKKLDFIERVRRLEYRPTVRMSLPGVRGYVDGVIVLNEQFDFKSYILPEEKWLVFDTIRDKTGVNNQLKDMRFKIQSRPIRNDHELKEYPELKKIINNTHNLLLRPSPTTEVYGVNRDFKDRIKFMRYKDVREFEYRGKGASQNGMEFMHRITIRVNIGKEFTRPNYDGTFIEVSEDRVEVTVVPDLPDLRDAEESDQFIRQIWQFSKEFGEVLQGQL